VNMRVSREMKRAPNLKMGERVKSKGQDQIDSIAERKATKLLERSEEEVSHDAEGPIHEKKRSANNQVLRKSGRSTC